MHLHDLIPDADHLCAMEMNELGLLMLPVLLAQHGGRGRDIVTPVDLDNFLRTMVGSGPNPECRWGNARHGDITWSIREAWAWLEGQAMLIPDPAYRQPTTQMRLSSKARKLAQSENPLQEFKARRLEKESLHPALREDTWSLFHRGKFDTAVFEATKAVEVAVRDAAELPPTEFGKEMMRKAFHPETGELRDPTLVASERQALSDLFAGAIGFFKNPQSHRVVDLNNPSEAAEIITIASWLLRQVDARVAAKMGEE